MAVIQTVRFRLNEGSDEGEFRVINERFQREVVPTLPGLLRREATRSADGEWLLILRYDNAENVGKAQRGDTSEIARALMGFIDMRTMSAGVSEIISE